MRKQHYTAEIPVSNPYNIAAFEDLVSNIQAGYNEEKRLKNAAFEFMIDRGIYLEFHEWLHAPEHKEHGSDVMGRLRMYMTGNRPPKIYGTDRRTACVVRCNFTGLSGSECGLSGVASKNRYTLRKERGCTARQ